MDDTVVRFILFHRINHFIAMLAFTTAVVTGMPLKYANYEWAQMWIRFIGGVKAAGFTHRVAAVFIGTYFVLEASFFLVKAAQHHGPITGPLSIVPSLRDARDVRLMIRWFAGRGPRPAFGRYTYWEKFDYWTLMAGTLVIGVTGLMLWFPTAVTRVLPGIAVNVALIIHTNEAVLAFGTIFIFVHLFHAHLRPEVFPFDRVIFTGRVRKREIKELRGREYRRIFPGHE